VVYVNQKVDIFIMTILPYLVINLNDSAQYQQSFNPLVPSQSDLFQSNSSES